MNASEYGCCHANCDGPSCIKYEYYDCGDSMHIIHYRSSDSYSYDNCNTVCPHSVECYGIPPTPAPSPTPTPQPTPTPSDPENDSDGISAAVVLTFASLILCLILTLTCCIKKKRHNAENGVAQRNLQNADEQRLEENQP